jgi:hypothetical protein
VIVRRNGKLPPGMSPGSASGKALWRKREVVKQEKTVHYTTIEADGGLQELVEKETTQTEILHMECRETGEFAHRELTEFEQVETFNDEVRGKTNIHFLSFHDDLIFFFLVLFLLLSW